MTGAPKDGSRKAGPSSDASAGGPDRFRARAGGSASAVILATFASQAAVSFGMVSVDLLAPALAERNGLNERDFSLGSTFIFIGVILVSPHLQGLMTRFGSAGLMAGATAAMSVGMLAVLHGSWWSTMLACAVYGLCYGLYSPASASVVASRAPPGRRALFMSLRQCGVPFAGAIAGRVLPWVVLAWGWRAGVLGVCAVIAAGAALILLLPGAFRVAAGEAGRGGTGEAGRGGRRAWLERYRLPAVMRAPVAAAIALAVTQIALSSFAYFYLLEVVRASALEAGAFLSNTLIASVAGRLLVGWFADRIGSPMRALMLIQVVSALTCLALPALSAGAPGWALLLVAAASGVSTGSWSPIFMTAISNLAPAGRMADFNGRAFSYAALGWCLAPPVIWSAIELAGGYAPVWCALGALNLLLAWRATASAR